MKWRIDPKRQNRYPTRKRIEGIDWPLCQAGETRAYNLGRFNLAPLDRIYGIEIENRLLDGILTLFAWFGLANISAIYWAVQASWTD